MTRAGLALLLLLGCGESDPDTAVIVRLDAEGSLRTRVTRVALRVGGADAGGATVDVFAQEVSTTASRWPLTTVIAPKNGETGRSFRYEADAFDGAGTQLGQIRVAASFIDGERVQLDLVFVEGCAGLACADQSCERRGGAARCVAPERELRPRDADGGVDGGLDGGVDGGVRDASIPDGTIPDGGALAPPTLRWPPNGFDTGSARAEASRRPWLRWERVSDATRYQLQLRRCASDSSITECVDRLDTPTVEETVPAAPGDGMSWRPTTALEVETATPPLGSRYVWRVAACDAERCGNWSDARYLDVGGVFGDLDGDGYGDLAAGDPGAAVTDGGDTWVSAGAVTQYFGTTSSESLTDVSPSAAGEFGRTLAMGDFDGDGFGDLAVGTTAGVQVFWGSAIGLEPTPVPILAPVDAPDFGASLAGLGDVNGDGQDSLVIGWTPQNQVLVFAGAPDQTFGSPVMLDTIPPLGRTGALAYAAGDVDGNGFVDLLVGVPDAENVGAVVLFLSDGDALAVATTVDHPDATPMGVDLSRFGEVVAHGDFDGDGFEDLAIGDPDWGPASQGRVYIVHGGRDGLEDTWIRLDAQVDTGSNFGSALAVGDMDGDGDAEVAASAPFWFDGVAAVGRVYVYGEMGAPVEAGAWMPMDSPAAATTGGFGRVLALTDSDGDLTPELLVGAPTEQRIYRVDRRTPASAQVLISAHDNAQEFPSTFAPAAGSKRLR